MKREKGVLIGFILIGIVLGSIIYIAAQEEGELATAKPAKVNVTVRASANPPIVIYVNNVSIYVEAPFNMWETGNLDLNVGPATTTYMFNFWAYYDGGENMLPGAVAGEDVTLYVKGNFSYSAKVRNIVKCNYRNVVPLAVYPPGNAKNYTCNVTMLYSDDPYSSGAWKINVQINTTELGSAIFSAVNNSQVFKIKRTAEMDIYPASVNWTTNQITSNAVNTWSDNAIGIINYGNIPIQTATSNKLQIQAFALKGEQRPLETFGATNFTANEGLPSASTCTGAAFAESSFSDVTINAVVGATTNLGFCAKTATDVAPQSYSSVASGSPWVIQNFCSGCL